MHPNIYCPIYSNVRLVYNKNAEDPEFYNTAWTLQIIRGLLLFIAGIASSLPIARFYHATILVVVVPVTAFGFVFTGCTSISVFLLQRRIKVATLNTFDIVVTSIATVAQVAVAYIMPTVWALVIGQLFGFAGVLLALPVSAVLLVALRHLRAAYQDSPLYH